MKGYMIRVLFAMVAVILLAGCSTAKPENSPRTETAPQSPAQLIAWQADGIISANEYFKMQKMGDVEVHTRVEGEFILMALRAKTIGYIALGIDPEDKMKNADMILCFVKDNQAYAVDMFSTGLFGPHPEDVKQGGTNDIITVGGIEKDGITTVEFKRKLNTGDSKDKVIRLGDNKILWATGNSDTITEKHAARGHGMLTVGN